MAEFSLDVSGIEKDVETSLEEEKSSLPNEQIKEQADENAIAIFEADLDNVAERESITKPLEEFGLPAINRSAQKNSLLNELNRQVKSLDPSGINFVDEGILGKLVNPVKRYFEKYEKAEAVIANIIDSLDQSSKVLQNDNTTLLSEEDYLRQLTKKLMSDIELGKQMDASIEAQIRNAEIQGVEQAKIDYVKEEILFPLRQRIMDMQQMIVVNQQGIVSLNVVRRNNKELIRGINRAETVTVTALRTGVMVASALYNQKIAMDKIKALNATTEDIISSTSQILKQQGQEIQKTSTETMISPEVLKQSFADALTAIQDVSTFKQEALPKMQETINAFSEMAIEGQKAVDKIETKNDGL